MTRWNPFSIRVNLILVDILLPFSHVHIHLLWSALNDPTNLLRDSIWSSDLKPLNCNRWASYEPYLARSDQIGHVSTSENLHVFILQLEIFPLMNGCYVAGNNRATATREIDFWDRLLGEKSAGISSKRQHREYHLHWSSEIATG